MLGTLMLWYLFLGGMGAGSFFILAVLSLALTSHRLPSPKQPRLDARPARAMRSSSCKALIRAGLVASLFITIFGILCLYFDLERPDKALLLITRPSFSLISIGAFLLGGLALCTAALAAVYLFDVALPRWARLAVHLLGIAFSLGAMTYTGVLLYSMNAGVPFWNSPFIPVLFVASSLSTGAAVVLGCMHLLDLAAEQCDLLETLLRFDIALIAVEVVCLGVLTVRLSPSGGVALIPACLGTGDVSLAFWIGIVLVGIIIALALDASIVHWHVRSLTGVLAFAMLVGGFAIRYFIVEGGAHPELMSILSSNVALAG